MRERRFVKLSTIIMRIISKSFEVSARKVTQSINSILLKLTRMLIIFTFQAAKRNANYSSEGSYLSRILIRMSFCKMKSNEKFKLLEP